MPRQLPWKIGGATGKQTSSRPKAAASPAPSASRSPAPSHRPTLTPKTEPATKAKRSLGLSSGIPSASSGCRADHANLSARSPSTSPPPEPLKEECLTTSDRFMVEGIDDDDKYRMVEDEFLAVAKQFTQHLHAAEYQRLKGLAKSENAETIQNISRPVTGEMTDVVKRRHAALDTASKQRNGIAKALGKRATRNTSRSDDEKEPPARRSATSLQGLMDSPRKQAVLLTSTAGSRPGSSYRDAMDASPSRRRPSGSGNGGMGRNGSMDMSDTKQSAQFVRFKPEPTPDSEDDDLDGQPPWPPKPYPQRSEQAAVPPNRQSSAPGPLARTKSEPSHARNPFLRPGTARLQTIAQQAATTNERVGAHHDEEEDDFFSRLRARRAEQKRRRETKVQNDNTKTSETQAAAINSIPFL
ncbi:hypothetical protein C8A00DRAFT_11157 [Chaetomidium leptoderma]|uniref:Uncharacterized protein n=1 Tax=Chaetomidium leptoderma TaxID=669021 RepID=A0AAN6VWG4_9PEZI|nr:hypothetical protein C8A00DRAFT_11157 [Chaetomidium leptoderma]